MALSSLRRLYVKVFADVSHGRRIAAFIDAGDDEVEDLLLSIGEVFHSRVSRERLSENYPNESGWRCQGFTYTIVEVYVGSLVSPRGSWGSRF